MKYHEYQHKRSIESSQAVLAMYENEDSPYYDDELDELIKRIQIDYSLTGDAAILALQQIVTGFCRTRLREFDIRVGRYFEEDD